MAPRSRSGYWKRVAPSTMPGTPLAQMYSGRSSPRVVYPYQQHKAAHDDQLTIITPLYHNHTPVTVGRTTRTQIFSPQVTEVISTTVPVSPAQRISQHRHVAAPYVTASPYVDTSPCDSPYLTGSPYLGAPSSPYLGLADRVARSPQYSPYRHTEQQQAEKWCSPTRTSGWVSTPCRTTRTQIFSPQAIEVIAPIEPSKRLLSRG